MASAGVWVKVVIPVIFIILTIAAILLFLMMLGVMPGMSLKKATGLSGHISVTSVNCVDLTASHAITSEGNMQVLGGDLSVLSGNISASKNINAASGVVNCNDLIATHCVTSEGNMQVTGGGLTIKGGLTLAGDLDATGYTVSCSDLIATHAITSEGNMQVTGGGLILKGDLDASGHKVTADTIIAASAVDVAPGAKNYLTLYEGNLSMSGNVTSGGSK